MKLTSALRIRYWLPPIVWMAFIFMLSSRTRVGVEGDYWTNFIVFKTLHIIEYATLFTLLVRAFAAGEKPSSGHFKSALITTMLYAISDEIHQTFIPTREGTLRDVVIDTIGAGIAWLFIRRYYERVRILFV